MSIVLISAALKTHLNSAAPLIPSVAISSVTAASPAVFTTATPHLLTTGLEVVVSDTTGFTPALDGKYLVVVTGASTFTLQNTATKSAISVTIVGSGGSVLANLTARRNVSFQAPIGIPYQQIDLLPGEPLGPTQGGGFKQEIGIFQITLVYPKGIGEGAALARAEVLRTAFKKGVDFTYSGVTVSMHKHPQIGSAYETNESYCVPVKTYYLANIFT